MIDTPVAAQHLRAVANILYTVHRVEGRQNTGGINHLLPHTPECFRLANDSVELPRSGSV